MCGSCVATVTPFLNKAFGENAWKVDTTSPVKQLTVTNVELDEADVIRAVEGAGYKAEKLA